MKRLSILLIILFLPGSLIANGQAQTNKVTSSAKVITGATLIDGTGRPPIRDAVIVIEGDRINQVGGPATKIPKGAQRIDARGKYVIPGLADMHNHLDEGTFVPRRDPPTYRKNLKEMLGWGFTLIFAPGLSESFTELKSLAREDSGSYPHFFGVARQFGAKGGHGSAGGYSPETPAEARAAVREIKATGADAVKLVYTDLIYVSKQPFPMLKADVMAAIIDEAHKQGLKAYVHAPVLRYAKEVLRSGADGLVHGILSDPIDDEFISLMKKNRAIYIPTHSIFESVADLGGWARRAAAMDERALIPKEVFEVGMNPATVKQWEDKWNNLSYMRERLPVLRSNTKKAWDAGILVVAGSDTGNSGSGVLLGLASQLELVLLVEAGLTPEQTIQAATINAARMVGRESSLGSVAPGKLADLVILDENPLSDIRNVRSIYRVVKNGVAYNPAGLLSPATGEIP
jgi:imidazolonepropionase-like amidohydrolase